MTKTLQEILLEENNKKGKNKQKKNNKEIITNEESTVTYEDVITPEVIEDVKFLQEELPEEINEEVDIEKLNFEHIDLSEKPIEEKQEEKTKFVLVKEKVVGKTKEVVSHKNFKKVIVCVAGVIGVVSIILIAKSCADSQKGKDNNPNTENNNEIILDNDTTTTDKPDSSIDKNDEIKDEQNNIPKTNIDKELEEFSTINYVTKEEIIALFKNAEKEFKGTNVTTEELAAFVVEINKTSINSELKELLISSGVINENEQLNRQNYLNTIDKIRNSMINAYTIEIDPELVGRPEYDVLIEELKANAIKVNVSNLVSKKSKEYEMYKLLDDTYNKIGESKTLEEAKKSYEPVLEYVNSENSKNMPNNMEEEIYKDLYKDSYDEITASKFNVSITELDRVYFFEEETECTKTLIK